MADMKVLEALEVTTIAIKEYTNTKLREAKDYTDNNTISHSQMQALSEDAKYIAKNNMGIYVQNEEPEGAVDGDIWIDEETVGEDFEIDKTLTKEGCAADAKVVGEALAGKQPVGEYALVGDIPEVPDWAKSATKPTYTALEVGADPSGTAGVAIGEHNSDTNAHADIRAVMSKQKPLEVMVDDSNVASHSASEIITHLDNGGSVIMKFSGNSRGHGYAQLHSVALGNVIFYELNVSVTSEILLYTVGDTKEVSVEVFTMVPVDSTDETIMGIKITENADGSVTMVNTFDGGGTETIVLAAGDKPASVTYNGVSIPIEWAVSE